MGKSAILAVVLMILGAAMSAAGEPLPAPTPIQSDPAAVVLRPWGRVNRYAVWQNYGVDLQGRFRPRVVYTPEGAFYYSNGQPYPWLSGNPGSFMPYAND